MVVRAMPAQMNDICRSLGHDPSVTTYNDPRVGPKVRSIRCASHLTTHSKSTPVEVPSQFFIFPSSSRTSVTCSMVHPKL